MVEDFKSDQDSIQVSQTYASLKNNYYSQKEKKTLDSSYSITINKYIRWGSLEE